MPDTLRWDKPTLYDETNGTATYSLLGTEDVHEVVVQVESEGSHVVSGIKIPADVLLRMANSISTPHMSGAVNVSALKVFANEQILSLLKDNIGLLRECVSDDISLGLLLASVITKDDCEGGDGSVYCINHESDDFKFLRCVIRFAIETIENLRL